jgi:hypothetical protein
MMNGVTDWHVSGSYFETCNCQAACPCRRQNGAPGGRSTFGVCEFFLTWYIRKGAAGEHDLAGLCVAMAGFYNDDEDGAPWSVILYVDAAASPQQQKALTEIFLGRAGGNVFFTANIADVIAVRVAQITLDHTPGREAVRVETFAEARTKRLAEFEGVISCGIPGHDHPGREVIADALVNDGSLGWSYEARCGFATDFAHGG